MAIPEQITGESYTYDEDGNAEEGVTLEMRFKSLAGTGFVLSTAIRTETSDATGLVSFTNLFVGATYEMRREENGIWTEIEIPTDASNPYTLPNFSGIDE
ncbi:unnamed protein product [marine sediment metagenome]|uniref:Uncharacterized protein n=1 Tax=marine sediment metagenome TaxID=412755 RepID=X0TB29_9ZZZZ